MIGVIGRGIIGLAVAFELIKAGFEVVMIGPRETENSASHCALGLSSMKGLMLPRDPLFKAKLRGHYLFPYWLNAVSQQLPSKHKIPIYRGQVREPYQDLADYERIRKRAFTAAYTGLYQIEDCRQQGFFHYPWDYWFHSQKLLNALDDANSEGAKAVHSDFFVNKIISLNSGGYQLISTRGAELPLAAVVLAAGVSSVDVLKNSQILSLYQNRIAGHSLYANADFLTRHSSIFGAASLNFYDGYASFGSTGFDLDKAGEIHDKDLSDLRARLSVVHSSDLPWLPRYGVRSRLADRMPAIGPVSAEHPRLLVAMGLYKNAFSLAPLIAKAITVYFKRVKVGFIPELFKTFSPQRASIRTKS